MGVEELKKGREIKSEGGDLREPYLIDYVAGGALSGGMAWIWSMFINHLINIEFLENKEVLYLLSIVFYIFIAFLTSFLVSKRFDRGHVLIGLKTSLFSWATIIFIYIPSGGDISKATILFYSTLFFCMILGGYLGGNLSKQIFQVDVRNRGKDG